MRIVDNLYGVAVLALALALLPTAMDGFERNIMFNVALYTVLGIGLNVVVGYAGLLDLGYVAFFAAGAYLYALVVAPDAGASEWAQNWDLGLTFWPVLPLALVAAALIGVALGVPVLRLRGDYLAIVTLGFGEIIRIMANNEDYYTSGPRGLFLLPKPPFFGRELDTAQELYFVVLVVAFVAVFAAERIRDSRVGRAWEAIREDEDVASSMGIDTTVYKLLAFAIGAAIGGVGGVIVAAKQGSVFPTDFNLDVSINVLALVIIGGMGNVRGILLGALLVVGLPDVLRDFNLDLGFVTFQNVGADYRLVIFGAALVAVMVLRPEGLLPSRRRAAEFREAELLEQEYAT
ncbi:MAG: ABC transporter ATP-binding protein [Chloroflexi bacterium]|nr:ABC transporter ATP-binding protein [Chloroflexota bacterium]